MNESQNKTKLEIQYDMMISNKDRVFSPNSKTWEFTKKSTQGSYNINNEIILTQNSDQIILEENKFKTENNLMKIEHDNSEGFQKRFSKFDIKIDYKHNLRLRNSSSMKITANNNKKIFDKQFNEIKKNFDSNEQNNFSCINNKKVSESSIKANKKIRTDAYGAPIIKNNKKFRVTFIDLLQNRDDIKNPILNIDKNMNYKNNKEDKINIMSKLNNNLYNSNNNFGMYNKINKNRKFIEEIKIKSYKIYNVHIEEDESQKANCSSCFCVIF